MKKVILKKDSRGFTNHEWLKSYHTFSFGNYYDETRMGFGNLRVLNEDYIKPQNGFGTHTHDNIEIITIPLEGSLIHKDNLGNECHLEFGDIQVLSTGSGLTHSQYNPSESETSNFLQLWVLPDCFNSTPSCEVRNFSFEPDHLILVASRDGKLNTLKIQQNAQLHMGKFSPGNEVRLGRSSEENGIFLFVIQGKITIAREELNAGDALGLTDHGESTVDVIENSFLMLLDISMNRKTD